MTKAQLTEALNIIEDILSETANDPDQKHIYEIAKAVYYILYYKIRKEL